MKEVFLTNSPLKAMVDDDDYFWVIKKKWSFSRGYAFCTSTLLGKRNIKLHRFILNYHGEKEIDHIDGNGLNNQKSNLRVCTHQENGLNKKTHKNNRCGLKGVSQFRWNKNMLWRARIQFQKKPIHIGTFKTKEEAALAYNEKAKELFGEFARLNKT